MRITLAVLLFATLAEAAPSNLSEEKRTEAREHYNNGTKKFNVAKFDEAAAEFVAAYEIAGEASLLYNIAQSYRMAEQHEKALFFFKSFLRQLDAKNPLRGEVEKRIAELTAAVEQAKHAATSPPTGTIRPELAGSRPETTRPETTRPETTRPETTKPETKPETSKPLTETKTKAGEGKQPSGSPTLKYAGIALAGLAVAGLAVGAGMSGAAAHDSSVLEDASQKQSAFGPHLQSAEKNGKLYDNVSYAFYGIGGAAAVAAAVTLYFGYRKPASTRAQVVPTFGTGSAGLALQGSF